MTFMKTICYYSTEVFSRDNYKTFLIPLFNLLNKYCGGGGSRAVVV